MEVQVFCLPGYRISSVGKVSALTVGIQGSQLGLVPWPFLCKRGKAAGSLDTKYIWVIQRGVGGGQPEQMRNRWRPFPDASWLARGVCKGKERLCQEQLF